MPNRIITDTETDKTDTIVQAGLLLEIDYPGSLTSTAILAVNGSTFRMTTGSSLSTSGTQNAIPAAGLIGLGLNGTVTIDGAVITTAGLTGIGNSHLAGQSGTGVGTVTVSGGSHVTDTWAGLGEWDDAGPDQGTLTITGANTTWYDGGDQAANGNFGGMTVGLSGDGTLLVLAGATLTERSYGDIASYATSNATATVDGAGSYWNIGTNLRVGDAGIGALTVSQQAKVFAGTYVSIGYQAGSQGTVTVDNATLTATSKLIVGDSGTGTITVQNHGIVTADEVDIANQVGSTGTVIVDNATLTSKGQILVGLSDSGTLTIRNNASITATDVVIGYATGVASQGTVTVNNATLTASGRITAGNGGPGRLVISNGGVVHAASAWAAGGPTGVDFLTPSFIKVDGANSKLLITGDAIVDQATPTADTATFTNGKFGTWVYTDNRVGSFFATNGGYISAGHALELQQPNGSLVPVALTVNLGGSVEVGGNSGPTADTLTIDASGIVAGHGQIVVGNTVNGNFVNGTLANDGVILAQQGTLEVWGDVTGNGRVQINTNATFELHGAFGGTVVFNGGYASTLRLDDPNTVDFQGLIGNLAIGDTIELLTSKLPGNVAHTYINGGNTLYVTFSNGLSWTYNLAGNYSGDTFTIRETKEGGQTYEALTLQPASPQILTGVSGTSSSEYVNSLVWGWGAWNPAAGPIRYWFGTQNDVQPAVLEHGKSTLLDGTSSVDAWTSTEQNAFYQSLNDYAAVSGLTFAPAYSLDTANVVWWLDPALGPKVLGQSDVPAQVAGGQLWQYFNDTPWLSDPSQLSFGGDGQNTITHELGHTLGLAHPFDGGAEPDATVFPVADAQDQGIYTVMSYTQGWSGVDPNPPPLNYGTQGALGALDIAAIQTLYGVNTSTGAGDNTYVLPTLNAPGTGWSCIWDPNGFNTISNAGSAYACIIDLRAAPLTGSDPGGYASFAETILGGYTIANGTVIDGAIGGTANDTFVTNDGPDVINGGGGNDTVEFSLPVGSYTLDKTGNTITVTLNPVANPLAKQASVTDTLINISQLRFADQTIQASDVTCFAKGTRLATPHGDVAVEHLGAGDLVLAQTAEGPVPMPIRWIGHRRIDIVRHPQPDFVRPIRIRRDAIAPGQPSRDLLLSPDHALFVDGLLIPARQLLNGGSIVQDTSARAVRYFHVELDRHAIIGAEGLPAESYLDTGNRDWFENNPTGTRLHPVFTPPAGPVPGEAAPRADGVQAEAIWTRVAGRSRDLGYVPAEQTLTADPSVQLRIGMRAIRPVITEGHRIVFALPGAAIGPVRLLSRATRPADVQPWRDDRRRLGLCIDRIRWHGANDVQDLPMDHPTLTQGWWTIERDTGRPHRWTNGDAILPLPAGALTLEIRLAGNCRYELVAAADRQAA